MRNRALQVRLVKTQTEDVNGSVPQEAEFEFKVATVTNALDKIFKRVGTAALAYVVIDTARKVIIAKATQE